MSNQEEYAYTYQGQTYQGGNAVRRGIINRAFGFRDFDNFCLQVLVECGGT